MADREFPPDEVAAAADALAGEWPDEERGVLERAARAALTAARQALDARIRAQVAADMAERERVLREHGIDPSLAVRGVSGDIHEVVMLLDPAKGYPPTIRGRNHICELDGVEIDGHSAPDGMCIYCSKEIW